MDAIFMTKIVCHDSNDFGLMVVSHMPVVQYTILVTLRRDDKLKNVTRVTWCSTESMKEV